MTRLLLAVLICCCSIVPAAADDYLEARRNLGLKNADEYSYVLMQRAGQDEGQARAMLGKAIQVSPDLPAPYFARAAQNLSFSSVAVLESIDDVVRGLDAYGRNFWWNYTFMGSIFFGILFSLLAALFFVFLLRVITDLPLLSHEMKESPAIGIFLIGMLLLSAASPLVFVLCGLLMVGIFMSRPDRAVVVFALIVMIASPLLFRTAEVFVRGFTSGTLKAVVDVNESRDNGYALAVLGPQSRGPELFSYALALKRSGRYDEAVAAYERLLAERNDPKVLVNLGNCFFAIARPDKSIEYYEKAAAVQPLASAYYNLSQVYREILDFEKGDEYFRKALETDRNAVASYRAIYSRNPNRLVVDETLSQEELRAALLEMTAPASTFGLSLLPPWTFPFVAVGMAVVFIILVRQSSRAYRCSRCGVILCPRCERNLMWGGMCTSCFRSIVKLDESDARERVARLLAIYDTQQKKRRVMKAFSFLLPGAALIYGGRVLPGFLLLWLFLFFGFGAALLSTAAPAVFRVHGPAVIAAAICCVAVYLVSLAITRERMSKGWL